MKILIDKATVEQALEALEEYHYGEARIILRQALEQPVQEPVAWVNTGELQGLTLGHYSHVEIYTDESAGRTPLYTAPPQRKPLTKEQIRKIVAELIEGVTVSEAVLFHSVARAIEAAHDIKENT